MIIKQRIGKSRIYDILHRGVVMTCMLVTGVGFVNLVSIGFDIYKKKNQPVTNKESPEADVEQSAVGLQKL